MSLKLDWTLETREERNKFIHEYLKAVHMPFSEEDLDMMAKYILWAKDPKTGLTGRQEGLELPTRFKTWDPQEIQSLDALLESPSFSEALIKSPDDPVYKTPKLKFKRSTAREETTPFLKPYLESLFEEIDETELLLNFYEIAHEKRSVPPRQSLLDRLGADRIDQIQRRAFKLQQYEYIKKKHRLVELRRLQYIYKDSYKPQIYLQPSFNQHHVDSSPSFDINIEVKPVGIPSNLKVSEKIFNVERYPEPGDFNESELKEVSSLLWTTPAPSSRYFDFTDTRHLNQLVNFYDDLSTEDFRFDSTLPYFLKAWDMYVNLAQLKDFHRTILDAKIQHKSNTEIQAEVEHLYGHHYSLNYISTIYRQSILGEIARTAMKHREVCENLFFPENFKTCIDCGRTLLRDDDNFMKKSKVKDGYSPRCKRCEKILRDRRKENYK